MLSFTLLLLALEAVAIQPEPRLCRPDSGLLCDVYPSQIPEITRVEGTKPIADALTAVTGGPVGPSWCSEPQYAEWLVRIVQARVREISAEDGVFLTVDSVHAVTDEAVCERLARAEYRHRLGRWWGVTVVRAGNRYYVSAGFRAGEWTITSVYSTGFEKYLSLAH